MPKSILVVDDAAFMRRLLRDVLGAAGYRVLEAVNGRDAVEQYAESRPDLVTMDLAMPDMGGLEAIEKIRARDEHARIVVVTAAVCDDAMEHANALGVSAFVRKPFQPATLLDTVRRALLVQPASRC
jgi:two-component system chemotaxis response regulator CheY